MVSVTYPGSRKAGLV